MLIISGSLHPSSRSRILAAAAASQLVDMGVDADVFDLATRPLPLCDGATAYGDENVVDLSERITAAHGILIASPIYNYDVNAAVKNAIELTGRAWTGKVVGMMLAAGGGSSYMSAMGLAGSLMLDFRCVIVPRFVYATGDAFEGDRLADEDISGRVQTLVRETVTLAAAMQSAQRTD